MRILYLAHRIPYPPNKGDKIRSYHHVRHLAERHDVHVLAFVDEPADEQWAASLREYCRQVVLVRLDRRTALARGLVSLARGRSLSEGWFGAPAMRQAVARVARDGRFDVAWGFSSVMAQYLGDAGAPRSVVDFVDVDSEKWRQFSDDSRRPLRWLYALEAARLRAFERSAAASVDCVLFVAAGEAALFRSFASADADVRVVPNGVDTAYFRPQGRREGPPTMLFTGALDYRPNVEAVLWCAREVLPLVRREIPAARLLAVGHRPAPRLMREVEAQAGKLQVAGSVPDIRPYFEGANVYVAPLRLGRGVQNKVLEAMAMRVPVVASPLAVSGLAVEAGVQALVADTPAEFAAAVVSLLREPERGRRLAEAARRSLEAHYTWAANLTLLDSCLGAQGELTGQSTGERWTAYSA